MAPNCKTASRPHTHAGRASGATHQSRGRYSQRTISCETCGAKRNELYKYTRRAGGKDKYVNQEGAARQRTPTGCEDSLARKHEKTTEKTTRRKNEKTKLLKKGNPESGGGENPKNHKKSMPIATASEGSQRRPQRSSEAEQRQLPRANFI